MGYARVTIENGPFYESALLYHRENTIQKTGFDINKPSAFQEYPHPIFFKLAPAFIDHSGTENGPVHLETIDGLTEIFPGDTPQPFTDGKVTITISHEKE